MAMFGGRVRKLGKRLARRTARSLKRGKVTKGLQRLSRRLDRNDASDEQRTRIRERANVAQARMGGARGQEMRQARANARARMEERGAIAPRRQPGRPVGTPRRGSSS